MVLTKGQLDEQVAHYASLPYTIVIETWDDGDGPYYVARVIELDGCMIHGDTPEEALAEIEKVKPDWIKTHLELGNEMPQPLKLRQFSGQYRIRMQPSLHEALATRAELEGVSLNQYMNTVLAQAVGRDMERDSVKRRRRKKSVRKNEE